MTCKNRATEVMGLMDMEITPRMLDAGVIALRDAMPETSDDRVAELAKAVFLAMFNAIPAETAA